jgi:hypothetical protein
MVSAHRAHTPYDHGPLRAHTTAAPPTATHTFSPDRASRCEDFLEQQRELAVAVLDVLVGVGCFLDVQVADALLQAPQAPVDVFGLGEGLRRVLG